MEVDGYRSHRKSHLISPTKHWAAILARHAMRPIKDPHSASAAAYVDGRLVCSSVLPPSAKAHWSWGSPKHRARDGRTLDQLTSVLSEKVSVWGGDWNQPLAGNLSGFTRAAQSLILAAAMT